MQTRPPHILVDGLMTFTTKRPLILNQHAANITFVGFVTGHAAAFASRFMAHGFCRRNFRMALLAKLVSRFDQQGRLALRPCVRPVTSQTIAFNNRGMGIPLGQRHPRTKVFEFVTLETKRGGIHFDHAAVVAGMGTVAATALALRRGRMDAFLGKSGL